MHEPIADGSSPPGRHLYFAYGSNLNRTQMRRRCPDAVPVDLAVLHGWRLAFPRPGTQWRGGVAGLEPDPGGAVEGAVYALVDADLRALDTYEGVAEEAYERQAVRVTLPDGGPADAFTYVATPVPPGRFPPSAAYLRAMIRGGRDHGLPPRWVRHVRAVARAAGPPLPGFWSTLGWTALCMGLVFAVQIAAGVGAAAFVFIDMLRAGQRPDGAQLRAGLEANIAPLTGAALVIGAVACAVLIVLLARRYDRDALRYLGVVRFGRRALLGSCAALVVFLLGEFLLSVAYPRETPEVLRLLFQKQTWLPLLFVALVLAAPIYEELLFRGLLFKGLEIAGARPGTNLLLTTVLFTAAHAPQYGFPELLSVFVLGLLFGTVRQLSGSTTLTMLLHGAVNLASFLLLVLQQP